MDHQPYQISHQQSAGGGVSVKKSPMISEEETKIRQDKLDTEKITSFVSIGGDSGRGVSIRFSDRPEPRRDGVASSPASSGSSSDCLQSQLTAVKLKLEQKRKKIEEDKKKVELMMTSGGGWARLPPPDTPDPKWDPEPSQSELGRFDYAAVSVDSIPCSKIGK